MIDERIEQDHVCALRVVRDMLRAVTNQDAQPALSQRHVKQPVRGAYYAQIHFHRDDARLRQLAVDVLRERASAQADDQHVARLGME